MAWHRFNEMRGGRGEEVSVDGCTDRARHPPPSALTVGGVDNRNEVREFLVSRRAKITPEQAGLPHAGQRRVPGLRRSEVAALAGVSVEYYAKIERGSLGGASAGVLDSVARALHLDDAERAHLFHLARAADGTAGVVRPRRPSKQRAVRAGLRWTLDSITAAPAIVGNNRSDLIAANHLGRALYADLYTDPTTPPNFARFAFLDSAAGQDPHDKGLHDLVGELSTRSEEFRRRWGAHDLRTHGAGTKQFHHHIVGDLALAYESLDLRAEPGLTMTIYTAEPGSPTAESLSLLASWAAT